MELDSCYICYEKVSLAFSYNIKILLLVILQVGDQMVVKNTISQTILYFNSIGIIFPICIAVLKITSVVIAGLAI